MTDIPYEMILGDNVMFPADPVCSTSRSVSHLVAYIITAFDKEGIARLSCRNKGFAAKIGNILQRCKSPPVHDRNGEGEG